MIISTKSYEVESLTDFIIKFGKLEEAREIFKDVVLSEESDVYDIGDSDFFCCDETHIEEMLEKDPRRFVIQFIDTRKWNGWIIQELEKSEDIISKGQCINCGSLEYSRDAPDFIDDIIHCKCECKCGYTFTEMFELTSQFKED